MEMLVHGRTGNDIILRDNSLVHEPDMATSSRRRRSRYVFVQSLFIWQGHNSGVTVVLSARTRTTPVHVLPGSLTLVDDIPFFECLDCDR